MNGGKWANHQASHFSLSKFGFCQWHILSNGTTQTYFVISNQLILRENQPQAQNSTNLRFYPEQNDATDTFYPMGPPKPISLLNITLFYGKWATHLLIINAVPNQSNPNDSIIIFPILFNFALFCPGTCSSVNKTKNGGLRRHSDSCLCSILNTRFPKTPKKRTIRIGKKSQFVGPTNWANWSHAAIDTPCIPQLMIFQLFGKQHFSNWIT